MPFPFHDPNWADVAAHLDDLVEADEVVGAPDVFWVVHPMVQRFGDTWAGGDDPDWLVVHKGAVDLLEPRLVARLLDERPVTLANEVFVVLGPARLGREPTAPGSPLHVHALREALAAGPWGPPDPDAGGALPEQGRIEWFGRLDLRGVAAAMDAFFEAGGYEYPTARDRAYSAALDRAIAELVGADPTRRRLDLAGGDGRTAAALGTDGVLVHTDLSGVAVRRARDRFPGLTGSVRLDAACLPIASGSIDDVVFCDGFEHVLDPFAVIAEAARVLRPGGHLFLTANNLGSLHLRVARALGAPDVPANHQHITEIAYPDLVAVLDRAGFDIGARRGVMLLPYWGLPGLDSVVARAVDEDPDVVAALTELGELGGPEHAFVAVVLAVRRPG